MITRSLGETIKWVDDVHATVLEVCEAAEDDQLPESALHWSESAAVTVEGIGKTIRKSQKVTPRQAEAIQNIESAAQRWLARVK